jgi:hypothetical protein
MLVGGFAEDPLPPPIASEVPAPKLGRGLRSLNSSLDRQLHGGILPPTPSPRFLKSPQAVDSVPHIQTTEFVL